MLSMNAYQADAAGFRRYPRPTPTDGLIYATLGCVGEAGELANEVKKIVRDDGGYLTDQRYEALLEELGDLQWYVACVASEIHTRLETIASQNLAKLDARYGKSSSG